MSQQVQCDKCYEVKDKQDVRDNGNSCPDCGGRSFRDT